MSEFQKLKGETQDEFIQRVLEPKGITWDEFVKMEEYAQYKGEEKDKSDSKSDGKDGDVKETNPDSGLGEVASMEAVPPSTFAPEVEEKLNTADTTDVVVRSRVIGNPTDPPFERKYKSFWELEAYGKDDYIRSRYTLLPEKWSTYNEYRRSIAKYIIKVMQSYDYIPWDVPEELNKHENRRKVVASGADGVNVTQFIDNLNSDDFHKLVEPMLLGRGREKNPDKLSYSDDVFMDPEEVSLLRRMMRVYQRHRVDVAEYHKMFEALSTNNRSLVPLPIHISSRNKMYYWKLKTWEGNVLGEFIRKNDIIRERLIAEVRAEVEANFTVQFNKERTEVSRQMLAQMEVRTNEFSQATDLPASLSTAAGRKFCSDALTSLMLGEFCYMRYPLQAGALEIQDTKVFFDIMMLKLLTPSYIWNPEDIINMNNYLAQHFLMYFKPKRQAKTIRVDDGVDHLAELLDEDYWGTSFSHGAGPFLRHFLNRGRNQPMPVPKHFKNFMNHDRDYESGTWYDGIGFLDRQGVHPRSVDFQNFVQALNELQRPTNTNAKTSIMKVLSSLATDTYSVKHFVITMNTALKYMFTSALAYPKGPESRATVVPTGFDYTYMGAFSCVRLGTWDVDKIINWDVKFHRWTWHEHLKLEEFIAYYHHFKKLLLEETTNKTELVTLAASMCEQKTGFIEVINDMIKNHHAESLLVPKAHDGFWQAKLSLATNFVQKNKPYNGILDSFYLSKQFDTVKEKKGDFLRYYALTVPRGSVRTVSVDGRAGSLDLTRTLAGEAYSELVEQVIRGELSCLKFEMPIYYVASRIDVSKGMPQAWDIPYDIMNNRFTELKFYYVEEDDDVNVHHPHFVTYTSPSFVPADGVFPFRMGHQVLHDLRNKADSLVADHHIFDDDKLISWKSTFMM
jgi:hypothetical protein